MTEWTGLRFYSLSWISTLKRWWLVELRSSKRTQLCHTQKSLRICITSLSCTQGEKSERSTPPERSWECACVKPKTNANPDHFPIDIQSISYHRRVCHPLSRCKCRCEGCTDASTERGSLASAFCRFLSSRRIQCFLCSKIPWGCTVVVNFTVVLQISHSTWCRCVWGSIVVWRTTPLGRVILVGWVMEGRDWVI